MAGIAGRARVMMTPQTARTSSKQNMTKEPMQLSFALVALSSTAYQCKAPSERCQTQATLVMCATWHECPILSRNLRQVASQKEPTHDGSSIRSTCQISSCISLLWPNIGSRSIESGSNKTKYATQTGCTSKCM